MASLRIERVSRSWVLSVVLVFAVTVLQESLVSARKCPDCDAQYWLCSWNCYASEGYRPTCMQRQSYLDGDGDPNPDNVEVFVNPCDADCYAQAYEDFENIKGFIPQYEQQANSTCDSAWRIKQASDYDFFSTQAFLYEGLLPQNPEELPQWLQDEVQGLQNGSIAIDDTELEMTRAECSICDPSARIAAAISPSVAPAQPPVTTPNIVPVDPPTTIIESQPAPEPAPEPSVAVVAPESSAADKAMLATGIALCWALGV